MQVCLYMYDSNMTLQQLSKTIALNIKSKHSLMSQSFLLDKFMYNYPYKDNQHMFHEQNKGPKSNIVFEDKRIQTEMIFWKQNEQILMKNGLTIVINGQLEEHVVHKNSNKLLYTRILKPNYSVLVDNHNFRHICKGLLDKTISFHVYSKQ